MTAENGLHSIAFMANHLEPGNFTSATKCILIELRVPLDSKGYRCLLMAIPMYRADPAQSLTKEIYPAVARRMGYRSWKMVEKQIRDAVAEGWKNRDREVWKRYFQGGRPSNGEFIATIAEMLDLWMACTGQAVK